MDRRTSDSSRGILLKLMCHGDPERSYHVRGKALPLCARCIAFYPLFLITAIISSPLFLAFRTGALSMTVVFILLVSPLVLDGGTQYLGWRVSNNPMRTITGALAGIGCGLALAYLSMRTLQVFIEL